MIRALALAAALAACHYDGDLGSRTSATSNPFDAVQQLPVDADLGPDMPANLAYDYYAMGGPLLVDSANANVLYAVKTLLAGSPESVVRIDGSNLNDMNYLGGPAVAMAQDATAIYALVAGSSAGRFDVIAISKTGHAAPPNGTVDAAAPTYTVTTLAHDLPDAAAIAVDAASIFVAQSGSTDGALVRMDKTGANTTTLLSTPGLAAVAVDANYAYVVERVPSGRLLAVPKSGGSARVLATGLAMPRAIDLAAGNVLITEQGDAVTGGAIGAIAAPLPAAPVGTFARIVAGAHTPVDLTHDDTYVYWTAERDGLLRAPLAGGTPDVRMATTKPGNSAIAVQGDHVLFVGATDYGAPGVYAVNR